MSLLVSLDQYIKNILSEPAQKAHVQRVWQTDLSLESLYFVFRFEMIAYHENIQKITYFCSVRVCGCLKHK